MAEEHGESIGEILLGSFIDASHTAPPQHVAALVADRATLIGASDVRVYLQDYDQRLLIPLVLDGEDRLEPLVIATTVAGRAFYSMDAIEVPVEGGMVRRWIPLLDGTDRVGVIGLTLGAIDDRLRQLTVRYASLVSDLIVTKGSYGDAFFLTRRTRPMNLPAEMQWHLLPPLTITTDRVSIAGAVEPAHEVGGDAFDYAVNGDVAHLAIVDAMGHGLSASVMAQVAVGSYRHSRRQGVDLGEQYRAMDVAFRSQFDESRFVTALMAELDLGTGELSWVNAGHPPPMVMRHRRLIRRLEGDISVPVGFGGGTPSIAVERLQPGDSVLFFTDGAVESRDWADDPAYGEDHLVNALGRELTEGRLVVETVRRVSHAVLDLHGGELDDDVTLLLVQWHGAA